MAMALAWIAGECALVLSVLGRYAWLLWLSWVCANNGRHHLWVHPTFFYFTNAHRWLPKTWGHAKTNHAISVFHAANVFIFGAWILLYQVMANGIWKVLDFEELIYGEWPHAYILVYLSCGFFVYNQLHFIEHVRDFKDDGDVVPTLVNHCLQLIAFTFPLFWDVMINYSIVVLVSFALWELCRRIKVELEFKVRLGLRPVEELA